MFITKLTAGESDLVMGLTLKHELSPLIRKGRAIYNQLSLKIISYKHHGAGRGRRHLHYLESRENVLDTTVKQ